MSCDHALRVLLRLLSKRAAPTGTGSMLSVCRLEHLQNTHRTVSVAERCAMLPPYSNGVLWSREILFGYVTGPKMPLCRLVRSQGSSPVISMSRRCLGDSLSPVAAVLTCTICRLQSGVSSPCSLRETWLLHPIKHDTIGSSRSGTLNIHLSDKCHPVRGHSRSVSRLPIPALSGACLY